MNVSDTSALVRPREPSMSTETPATPGAWAPRVCDPATGSWLRRKIVAQFRHPRGLAGHLAGLLMSRRSSNVFRSLETVRLLDVQASDRVLEIGFGPGVALAAAARNVRTGRVHGIDHSVAMLKMARRRNADAIAAGRVSLQRGTVEDLPVTEPPFDKVYAINVFHFWHDPPRVLGLLRARMAPGGLLAITHQPRHRRASSADTRASVDRITADLRAAGFSELHAQMLGARPVETVCVLGRAPAEAE